LIVPEQPDAHAPRAGVPGGVAEAFAGDPEDELLLVRAEPFGRVFG
jgi:hypothetical protein